MPRNTDMFTGKNYLLLFESKTLKGTENIIESYTVIKLMHKLFSFILFTVYSQVDDLV